MRVEILAYICCICKKDSPDPPFKTHYKLPLCSDVCYDKIKRRTLIYQVYFVVTMGASLTWVLLKLGNDIYATIVGACTIAFIVSAWEKLRDPTGKNEPKQGLGNSDMENEKKSDLKKFNWNELSWKDSFSLSLRTYLYFLLFYLIPFIITGIVSLSTGSLETDSFNSPIHIFTLALIALGQPLSFVCVFKFRFLKFKISNKKIYIIEESGKKIDCSWLLAFKLGWAHFWKSVILAVFMISANQIYYNFVVPPASQLIYLLVIIFSLMIVFKWTFSRKFDGLQIKLAQEDK